MRTLLAASAALVTCAGFAALTGCSFPTADDFHQRGRTTAFAKDTTSYRAMDNAIHDVLRDLEISVSVRKRDAATGEPMVDPKTKEPLYETKTSKLTLSLVEAPEREHHRWVAVTDENFRGARHRTRVEGRPMWDSDEKYSAQIMVREEFYVRGDQFSVGSPPEFGGNPWIEGGRDDKMESAIANAVNAKMREWRAAGCPEPGNRRDEWLAGKH